MEGKSSNTGFIIFLVFLVLLLVGVIVAGGIILLPEYFRDKVDEAVEEQLEGDTDLDSSVLDENEEEEDVEIDSQVGTISGSVSYPSEFIPEDMIICAEDLDSGDEYCADGLIEGDEFTYNMGYSIELPFGDYNVYSMLPGDTYKAYYSEFVPCGLSVDCPSHDPILVTVDSDVVQTGIDPIDWYN